MGEIHNWATCRCQLCLTSQRLLLLVYNEKLGDAFSRHCVRKLREVYLELLDEAESKSKDGVGRATYSTPAFKSEGTSKGSATPSGGKKKREAPSVKSEEEEPVSAASGSQGGGEKDTPVSTPSKSPKKEASKRSRSRHRRQRSTEKKSKRKDRSASRGRSRHSRSNVRTKKSPRKSRSPAPRPEHQGTAKASAEPSKEARPKTPPRPSYFDPAARRAAPPPTSRQPSRGETEGERKDRDKVLPRRKPQEPDHPPPGHQDDEDWSAYRAFPKSKGYRYWPVRNRGNQPTESKGKTKREKNLNYRLWNEYDREHGRR